VLVVLSALPLYPYYASYERGDYGRLIQRVELLQMPDDEVLLTGPWQDRYWFYYGRSDLFLHRVPLSVPPSLEEEDARSRLQFILERHKPKRLWFVQAGLEQADPTNFVERWLAANGWQGSREAYRNGVLSLWALEPRPMHVVQPVELRLGDLLAVRRVEVEEHPLAGSVLRLTFHLRLLKETTDVVKLSLRLFDGRGEYVQRDVYVGHPFHPTSTWQVGEEIEFRTGLVTPPGTKPGLYILGVVFYLETGEVLTVSVGGTPQPSEPFLLTQVEVERSGLRVVDPATTEQLAGASFWYGPEREEGPVIQLEAFSVPQRIRAPGESLDVLLVWRALRRSGERFFTVLQLLDTSDNVVWQQEDVIGGETYRVDRWIAEDFVRDWYQTRLPADLPAGEYHLVLQVKGPAGVSSLLTTAPDGGTAVPLGTVTVRAPGASPPPLPRWQRALQRLHKELTS